MSQLASYPKVYNLGHANIRDLLQDPVVIEEKVDGSQLSFGLIGGELLMRSKGAEIHPEAPPKMFAKGVEFVRGLDLHPEWTYRGEYLQKPKHNALVYDRVPAGHIAIFDINDGLESYLSYEDKEAEAQRLGFECVPRILPGPGTLGPMELQTMLSQPSFLGGQLVEGVVIKNYARFGRDGKALMGKHVSEKFKEVHRKSWKLSNPGSKDVVALIADGLRTPARWQKAVQHLRDRGELTDSPKDIGPLMKEVSQDVLAECGDDIKERLFKWAWKSIGRTVTRGLPEWYKNLLMEKQFEAEE